MAAATRSPVPLAAGAVAVPLVRSALCRRAERAVAERVSTAVSALCGTVAGDLRAGWPPNSALACALQSGEWSGTPELADVGRLALSAARFGGDVPQALREAARRSPGAHGLRAVAACWQVAVDGGAGLASALDRVAGALRAEADQREDVRAQLAGPRSTAVLLALLPAFGLVLGTGLGAGPVTVLLHTRTGLACLATGALLEWAGLAWTARIARAAEGPRASTGDAAGPARAGLPAAALSSGHPGGARFSGGSPGIATTLRAAVSLRRNGTWGRGVRRPRMSLPVFVSVPAPVPRGASAEPAPPGGGPGGSGAGRPLGVFALGAAFGRPSP
ncbi:type II secretion system F family protein [Actinacidiphila yeochonensis]|uniref:type II secretion system F family protein n=1 Tax=Actinacidiphila yeochonensis TaxID=89050 RepID=UPI002AFFEC5B|nr:type II secretion system F family protein [Actinacidiphila yeochonensis]